MDLMSHTLYGLSLFMRLRDAKKKTLGKHNEGQFFLLQRD